MSVFGKDATDSLYLLLCRYIRSQATRIVSGCILDDCNNYSAKRCADYAQRCRSAAGVTVAVNVGTVSAPRPNVLALTVCHLEEAAARTLLLCQSL